MNSSGIDIVNVNRVEQALKRWGDRFKKRIYTEKEVLYCRGKMSEFAARFAAKEAISKALGTGLRGISWREMEIVHDRRGKPLVNLYGRAKARAEELGLISFEISLSHTDDLAIAFVVASDH